MGQETMIGWQRAFALGVALADMLARVVASL